MQKALTNGNVAEAVIIVDQDGNNSSSSVSVTGAPDQDQAAQAVRVVGEMVDNAGFSAVGSSVIDVAFVQTPSWARACPTTRRPAP